MDLSVKNIPESIRFILNKLHDSGYEAYMVGGCVRDTLLGKEPHDWDVATSAAPSQIQRIFQSYPQFDTGLKHGTVTIVLYNEPIEITTFRIDGNYSDGRRPDAVSFTSSIEKDLSRRDFTINACAMTDSELIDPFGGKEDIQKKLIRCVGNPKQRFSEDSLRILRGIRLASVLDFSVEEETKAAMLECKNLLNNISQERITDEFRKAITGSCAGKTFSEFKEIISCIIPEAKKMIGFEQNNPYHIYDLYEHTVRSLDFIENDIVLRTAMFFHDIGKPECYFTDKSGIGHFYGHPEVSAKMAVQILKRMKFSNADINTIAVLIRYHDARIGLNTKNIKKWLNKLGESLFRKLLKIKKADILAQNPELACERIKDLNIIEGILHKLAAENTCIDLKGLAVNGNDLIRLGIPEGKEIGMILNRLLEMVINEEIENDRKTLISLIEKLKG